MKILKTIFLTLTAVFIANSASFAQRGQSSGNCVEQGTVLIDAFYGFPYFNGTLLKAAYASDSVATNSTIRNLNHLGGKVEYMVSDKIAIGLEFTYADVKIHYQGSNSLWYTGGIRKYRILGKMNYHFATTASIDPYLTWGAGYKNTKVYDDQPGTGPDVVLNLVPVAFRVGIGMRYFFTDMIGVNADVGLGGPMMQAGLSLKL